jgi:hypothetical protein
MLRKTVFITIGPILLAGCSPVSFFALANDITGTIVNLSLLTGGGALLFNINNLTQLVRGLVAGG